MEDLRQLSTTVSAFKNKVERKRALARLRDAFDSLPKEARETEGIASVLPTLYACLEDESERCRELAASWISEDAALAKSADLHHILPVVQKRMGSDGTPEEASEEVRKAYVAMVDRAVRERRETPDELGSYMDEYRDIVAGAVQDSYLDVKLAGCRLVSTLDAAVGKERFRQTLASSPSLSRSLLKNLTHQQKRIRIAAVETLQLLLVCSGTSETFALTASHLAQRLFDPMPEVRMAVAALAADLLKRWRCRSSNLPLLVPLLISSLEDEMPCNRESTLKLWMEVGEQFANEEAGKDKQVKDQIDFPPEEISHYPTNVVNRPTFGCRLLVGRIFFQLQSALERDLRDWRSDTRLKTAQLLSVLILHLEQGAAGHVELILSLLHQGAFDAEEDVVLYICKAANYFGHFVRPKQWVSLVFQRIQENPSHQDLRVLSHILSGVEPGTFVGHLEDAGLFLQQDSVCLTRNDDQLLEVLACCRSLVATCGPKCVTAEAPLFRVGVTVLALAQNDDLKAESQEYIDSLSSHAGLDSTPDLYKRQMFPMLKEFRQTCASWGPSSYEPLVFSTLLAESRWAAGYFAEAVVSLYRLALKESSPPELKIKLLLLLARQLSNANEAVNSQKQFSQYSKIVLTDVLLPQLEWRPGKKAQAVRTAAASCLWSLLASECIDAAQLSEITSSLLPVMNGLVEDGAEQVRLFVCRAIGSFLNIMGQGCSKTALVNTMTNVLRRLDDKNDFVRLFALDVIVAFPDCVNPQHIEEPDVRVFLDHAFKTLLLHADDPEEEIRQKCIATLKVLSPFETTALMEQAVAASKTHRHKQDVDMLVAHVKNIEVSN